MRILTIGFTRKSAEAFFSALTGSGAKRLLDVRLNNTSQLAGFAKKDDLKYFLSAICGMEYLHEPLLAPTPQMLKTYKKEKGTWSAYEKEFLELMKGRGVETALSKEVLAEACLLCSEEKAEHCHRRLVAEYLRDKWGGVEIVHL